MAPPKQFESCIRVHLDSSQKEQVTRMAGTMSVSGFVRVAVQRYLEDLLAGITIQLQLPHKLAIELGSLQMEDRCSLAELILKAIAHYLAYRRRQRHSNKPAGTEDLPSEVAA